MRKDHRVTEDPQAMTVCKDLRDQQVPQVRKVHKAFKALKVLTATKALKGRLDLVGP